MTKEILRKLIHLTELLLLLGYTIVRYFAGDQLGMLFLTAVLIILLEIEYVRLEYRLRLPDAINIIRHHERDNITGSIFFVIATIICFAAFDYHIALVAISMTVFGDLASALVGISVGRIKVHGKKTLEGFGAGLVVNCVVGYLLLPGSLLVFGFMALCASLVELFVGKLNDNLAVPVAAGFVGQALILLHGGDVPVFPGPLLQSIIDVLPF